MNSPAFLRVVATVFTVCLSLALAGCGNKGPLTLQARPAPEPATFEVDVPRSAAEQVDGLPQDVSGDNADAPPANPDEIPQ